MVLWLIKHTCIEEDLMPKTSNLLSQFRVPPLAPCLRSPGSDLQLLNRVPSTQEWIHLPTPVAPASTHSHASQSHLFGISNFDGICPFTTHPSPALLAELFCFRHWLLFLNFPHKLKIWISTLFFQPSCGFILKSCSGFLDCFLLLQTCQYCFSFMVGPIECTERRGKLLGTLAFCDLFLGNLILANWLNEGHLELGLVLINRILDGWRRQMEVIVNIFAWLERREMQIKTMGYHFILTIGKKKKKRKTKNYQMLARMWNVEQWEFTNTPGKSVNLCSHFINKVNNWVVIHSHSEMLFWKKKLRGRWTTTEHILSLGKYLKNIILNKRSKYWKNVMVWGRAVQSAHNLVLVALTAENPASQR